MKALELSRNIIKLLYSHLSNAVSSRKPSSKEFFFSSNAKQEARRHDELLCNETDDAECIDTHTHTHTCLLYVLEGATAAAVA